MSGVVKRRAQSIRECNGVAIADTGLLETIHRVQRIGQRVERRLFPVMAIVPGSPPRFLFLEMRRIQQHEAGEIAGRRRGDDLAAKALLHQ